MIVFYALKMLLFEWRLSKEVFHSKAGGFTGPHDWQLSIAGIGGRKKFIL
jgi:hypothetical protein